MVRRRSDRKGYKSRPASRRRARRGERPRPHPLPGSARRDARTAAARLRNGNLCGDRRRRARYPPVSLYAECVFGQHDGQLAARRNGKGARFGFRADRLLFCRRRRLQAEDFHGAGGRLREELRAAFAARIAGILYAAVRGYRHHEFLYGAGARDPDNAGRQKDLRSVRL